MPIVESMATTAQKELLSWYNSFEDVKVKRIKKSDLIDHINNWVSKNREKVEPNFVRVSDLMMQAWIMGRTTIKTWAAPLIVDYLKKNA